MNTVPPTAAGPFNGDPSAHANVFIGYDSRQPVAYQVAVHSVQKRATIPVAVTRLVLATLPMKRRGLTEFTYSRFLVPYLCGFEGFSIFMDADVLVLGNVKELLKLAIEETRRNQHSISVSVVPHGGERSFERASMMVFYNPACRMLTPEWIDNEANNPFKLETWAKGIGSLPKEWNHLVGYDAPNPKAKLVHYTMGVPVWPETKSCEFSKEWGVFAKHMMSTEPYAAIMGKSVHHQHVVAGALNQGGEKAPEPRIEDIQARAVDVPETTKPRPVACKVPARKKKAKARR